MRKNDLTDGLRIFAGGGGGLFPGRGLVFGGAYYRNFTVYISIYVMASIQILLHLEDRQLVCICTVPGQFFFGGVHDFVSLSFPRLEQSLPPF